MGTGEGKGKGASEGVGSEDCGGSRSTYVVPPGLQKQPKRGRATRLRLA
mgnify:CR=1 FL=1